jgi:hypothetical protein
MIWPENYSKPGVLHIGISDHSLVYTCRKLSVPKSKHKVVVTRCLKIITVMNSMKI